MIVDKPILGEDTYLDPLFADGLVSFWPFNEGSGNKVFDLSGNGNAGTFQGTAPSWSSGKFGPAVSLLGTDEYMSCGNKSILQLSKGTVIVWIKTSNAGVSYRGIIVKQQAYGIFMRNNEFGCFDFNAGLWRGSGISPNDDIWHQLAITFDGDVANGSKFFVDGVFISIFTMDITNQTVELEIGSSGGIQHFTGLIDIPLIYNTIFSASEVALLHREPFWGFKQRNSGIYTRI